LNLGSKVSQLRGSPTIEAAEKVRKLLAEKKDVVRFDIGEPDFDTPAHISKAGIEAIGKGYTHYTSARGIPELREVLSADLKGKGLDTSGQQLVFYPGSKFAIYAAFSLLLDAGDEVVIQDPLWPTYASIIEYLGGIPVRVRDWNEENPREFPVERFVERIGTKTKAVLLNTPCNPTGALVPERDVSRLLFECDAKNVPLILDRIYSALCFDDGAENLLPSYDLEAGNLVVISGFSKEFAMTGWRLGYTVASKRFTTLLAEFEENTTSCASSFVQAAAVTALTGPREWQKEMNDQYRRRRDLMVRGICGIPGWSCSSPPGAFYCFPKIPHLDSLSYASGLLEEMCVSTVAGAPFGPSGESHLRLSYTTSEERIEEGIRRIKKYDERIGKK
jgi:aspartate aminotransferase